MPSAAARPRDESGTHSVPFRLVRGGNRIPPIVIKLTKICTWVPMEVHG